LRIAALREREDGQNRFSGKGGACHHGREALASETIVGSTIHLLAAVITEGGGRVIWLAGQVGIVDDAGKPITDFDSQVRQAFRNVEKVLFRAGGKLKDLVTMTVFINEANKSQRSRLSGANSFPMGNFRPARCSPPPASRCPRLWLRFRVSR
jgi:enamine deaminase RidA (YjgF/YER057c/UK114 family)